MGRIEREGAMAVNSHWEFVLFLRSTGADQRGLYFVEFEFFKAVFIWSPSRNHDIFFFVCTEIDKKNQNNFCCSIGFWKVCCCSTTLNRYHKILVVFLSFLSFYLVTK